MSREFFGMDGLSPEQAMHMAEEEGQSDMVDTRKAIINAIINKIESFKRDNPYGDVMAAIDDIIESERVEIDSLSAKERQKIDRAIL